MPRIGNSTLNSTKVFHRQTTTSTGSGVIPISNSFVPPTYIPNAQGPLLFAQNASNATAGAINSLSNWPPHIRAQGDNWIYKALASMLEFFGFPNESVKAFTRAQVVTNSLERDKQSGELLEESWAVLSEQEKLVALQNKDAEKTFYKALSQVGIEENINPWTLFAKRGQIRDEMNRLIDSRQDLPEESKHQTKLIADGLLKMQLGGFTQFLNFFILPSWIGPNLYQAAAGQVKSGNTGFGQLLGGLAMAALSAQSLQIARDVYHMDFSHLGARTRLTVPFALAAVSVSHVLGSLLRIEQTVYDIGHANSDKEPNAIQKGINFFGKVFDFLNVSSIFCFLLHDLSRLNELNTRSAAFKRTNLFKMQRNVLFFRAGANALAAVFGLVANCFEPFVDNREESKTKDLRFMFRLAKIAFENQLLEAADIEKLKKASPEFKTKFQELLQILVARQQLEEQLIEPLKQLKDELEKQVAAGKMQPEEAQAMMKKALAQLEKQMSKAEEAIDKFIKDYMGNIPFQKWLVRFVKEASFWPLIVAMVGSRSFMALEKGANKQDTNSAKYKGFWGLMRGSRDAILEGDVTRDILGMGSLRSQETEPKWWKRLLSMAMKGWVFAEIPLAAVLLLGQGLQAVSEEGSPWKDMLSGINEAMKKNPFFAGVKTLTDIMIAS